MDEKDAQSERPPDGDFQQQNLKAWQPLLTPGWVIGTFLLIGCLFVPIGAIVLSASQNVVEAITKYDDIYPAVLCPNTQQNRTGCGTTVTLNIDKDMKAPIFMYYKLTNFYQNHRRYVKSRSDAQLRGSNPSDITSCEPLEQWEGKNLYPCGLIANSYFNDTFIDSAVTSGVVRTALPWTDTGIAWESDKDKFKEFTFDANTQTRVGPSGHQLPSVIKEDFIVWMRTAGLPTFKKLRYILNGVDLKAGDKVTFTVDNVFPVKDFSGEKFIVLSTTSWLGGRNDFLGFAYIIVGSLCLLLAAVFFVKHRFSPRPLGKMEYFNWTKNAASR